MSSLNLTLSDNPSLIILNYIICRTEVPVGAILETIYYRYLSFQENDGVVFYALTAKPPYEMIPCFLAVQAKSKDNGNPDNLNSNPMKNGIVQGTYQGKIIIRK